MPNPQVISLSSSDKPSGASLNDSGIPDKKLMSGCWYDKISPVFSSKTAIGDGTSNLLNSKLNEILLFESK